MEEKHCKWYNDEFCTNGDSPCVADYCPVVEYPELCKFREVDKDINVRRKTEEKKLTDEELVKALECCVKNDCEKCPYLIKGFDCVISKQEENDVLELIHRLQSENERLSLIAGMIDKGVAVEIVNMQETIDKQKAEIERLTEEHERIAWSKQQYLDWVHGFLTTHTDMKNRGEDYKMFDRDWMCGVFWEKIEGSIEYIIDLENQRNELQKQVDELKEQLLIAKLQGLTEGYLDGVQAERNAQIIKPTIVELPKEITQKIKEQAVKDTAKEILQKLYNMRDKDNIIRLELHNLEEFCDGYGVEVE